MNNAAIKEKLRSLSEPDYQKFSSRLSPGVYNILGVRLPLLRKLAKELAKGDWQTYLDTACDDSFEEIMLQGLTIGYVKSDLHTILPYITNFIPKIDSWSVCDSFCSGLKLTKLYPNDIWNYIIPYLSTNQPYSIRFGVVMLLFYYIDKEHIDQVLTYLDRIEHDSYYVKMSVAWALSICFVHFPKKTMNYLKGNHNLDDDTYKKTLQKILESRMVENEMKDVIRSMRR